MRSRFAFDVYIVQLSRRSFAALNDALACFVPCRLAGQLRHPRLLCYIIPECARVLPVYIGILKYPSDLCQVLVAVLYLQLLVPELNSLETCNPCLLRSHFVRGSLPQRCNTLISTSFPTQLY